MVYLSKTCILRTGLHCRDRKNNEQEKMDIEEEKKRESRIIIYKFNILGRMFGHKKSLIFDK